MASPVVTLNEIEKVKRVMEVLSSTSHNGFPVIGKDGKAHIPLSVISYFIV